MSSVTGNAYKSVFKKTFELVTENYSSFDNGNNIKGITVDFSLAQVKGLDSTLENGISKIKGCRSVHYMRNVDKVIAKVCKSDEENKLFELACKEITENSSQGNVQELFSCLDGTLRIEEINDDIKNMFTDADRGLNLAHWKSASHWVKWWSGDRVSILLCEAFKTMNEDDWLVTANHADHVESLNRVSVRCQARR